MSQETTLESEYTDVSADVYDQEDYDQLMQRIADEEDEQTFEQPEEDAGGGPAGMVRDESGRIYIGKEFTVDEFLRWFEVQNIGAQPYNGVGVHHTWSPNAAQWRGLPSLEGIFGYYRNNRGWPAGKGPQLWLYDGSGSYKSGQQLVYVGTHPRHDGIGIAYRNRRWLHIEAIYNGDAQPFGPRMLDLWRKVLSAVCEKRGIPLKSITIGKDNPSEPLGGYMFHRDVDPSNPPKSCPGKLNTRDAFDRAMASNFVALEEEKAPLRRGRAYTTEELNVREGPGTEFSIVRTLPKDAPVWVFNRASRNGKMLEWYKINVTGEKLRGFVHGGYLRQ